MIALNYNPTLAATTFTISTTITVSTTDTGPTKV